MITATTQQQHHKSRRRRPTMRDERVSSEWEDKIKETGAFLQLGQHLFLHQNTKLLIKAMGTKKTPLKVYHPLMTKQPGNLRDELFVQYHYMVQDEAQWSGHYRQVRKSSEYNYTVMERDESLFALMPTMKTWICKGCMLECFGEDVSNRDRYYVNHMKTSVGCMGKGMIECRGVVSIQTPVKFFVLADDNTRPFMLPIPDPLPQVLRATRKRRRRSSEALDGSKVFVLERPESGGALKELGVGISGAKRPRRKSNENGFKEQELVNFAPRPSLLEAIAEYKSTEKATRSPSRDEETPQKESPQKEQNGEEKDESVHMTLEDLVFEQVKEKLSSLSANGDNAVPLESLLAMIDKDPSTARRELPVTMLQFLQADILSQQEKEEIVQVSLRYLPAELIVSNKDRSLMMTVRLVRHIGEALTFTATVTLFIEDETPEKNVRAETYEISTVTLDKVCSLLKVLSVAMMTVVVHSFRGALELDSLRLKDIVFHCLENVELDGKTCWSLITNHFNQLFHPTEHS